MLVFCCRILVMKRKIWYHDYMTTETSISSIERHNAMISYCFLAPFMLISRDERFSNEFVRSHSRHALLIHLGFLALIATLIYSRNFSSIIIFEVSWVHIVIFIGFFLLLGTLGIGIYRAMSWEKPHFSLRGITLSEFSGIGNEISLDETQKMPLLLSHIPFLWIYLSQKYGNFLSGGTKFGNWAFTIAALFIWIDPSLTLFISWLCIVTFWIVYQAVSISSWDTINVIGDKFYSATDTHIFIKSLWAYAAGIFKQGNQLPDWKKIQEEEKINYEKNIQLNSSIKLSLPLISIVAIWYAKKNGNIHQAEIQSILVNILAIYALYAGSTALFMLLALTTFWSYYQIKWQKNTSIPFLWEVAEILEKIIEWKKWKSASQKITFTSNKI